jgi:hypothetical protein
MSNVVEFPNPNIPHWEATVRCLLCGHEHRAVAPVIAWAEGTQPVDCGACRGVRSCIEVDTSEQDWADACAEVEARAATTVPGELTPLEAAAISARDAMVETADEREADGDLQAAHYLRHRNDDLDRALFGDRYKHLAGLPNRDRVLMRKWLQAGLQFDRDKTTDP